MEPGEPSQDESDAANDVSQRKTVSSDEDCVKEDIEKDEKNQTQRHQNHSLDDVIGNLNDARKTRNRKNDFKVMVKLVCFISLIESLDDEFWTNSMHEELEQFTA